MYRLFEWLIYGHIHKWKIIKEIDIVDQQKNVIGFHYVLQCETCGELHDYDVNISNKSEYGYYIH